MKIKIFTSIILGFACSLVVLCQEKYDSVAKVPAELTEILNIDSVTIEEFSKQALYKIHELGRYISIIASKNVASNEKDIAIELALKLFVSSDKIIQISRVNQDGSVDIYQSTIKDYLKKLKALQYSNVKVAWSRINYVRKLELGKDGFYHGVISIEQKFSGFIDNIIAYQDVTKKYIEILLATLPVYTNGHKTLTWDVLLGDTEVIQTNVQ